MSLQQTLISPTWKGQLFSNELFRYLKATMRWSEAHKEGVNKERMEDER